VGKVHSRWPASWGLVFALLPAVFGLRPVYADDDYKPIYLPSMQVSRLDGTIKIDGQLNDTGWRTAAKAGNFAEHQPGDQVKPPVETIAYMTYDQSKLYVAFMCYDDPKEIRASMCDRERMFNDDCAALLLDTYGNSACAYEIFSNPYGIQGDGLWSRTGDEDMTYDLIFESAGVVTDSGYQVEFAIPFSSLRFPDKQEQEWRVDFWRNRPRESQEKYSWAAIDRDNSCWPCQWGTVTGVRDVNPGKGLEIMPSLVGYQSGGRNEQNEFVNDKIDGRVSVNGKYGVTSDIVTEATYNPDFSQIESDAAQIDVNTTFALFYEERRPFFQEGSDLFGTWLPLVYTRSINDPDFAGKVTARLNRTSFAYLAAQDVHSPFILPEEEGSGYLLGEKSISNIFRLRHDFAEDTHLGLLVTDRRVNGGGSGSALSLDSEIKFTKHFRVQAQAVASHTEEPNSQSLSDQIQRYVDAGAIKETFDDGKHTAAFDGESYWGRSWVVNLEQSSRNFDLDVQYLERSPTYRADNGYEPKNNLRLAEINGGYTYYLENSVVEWINPNFDIARRWNFDGWIRDEWVVVGASTRLKAAQTNLHAQYMRSGENFGGVQFDGIWNWHNCFSVYLSDHFAGGGSFDYGHRIARRHLRMGMEYYITGWLDIKPNDRVLWENWLDYNKSDDLNSGEELFDGYIYRTRLSYQFARRLSLRWIVQYDGFSEEWEVAPLITYRLSPFSVFYIGSTYDYDSFDNPNDSSFDRSARLYARQFFMKLQYLFQI
jgi:hypothetical protein